MVGLSALWLPILLSAVFVFIVSSVIHMVMPWHKDDYPPMPNEDAFRAAVGPLKVPPGDYMVPRPSTREDMNSPAFKAKMEQGPVMIVTVRPNGKPGMGSYLLLWFLYALAVSVFSAYISGRALPSGVVYLKVFRFAGATAFLAYSAALWQLWIWYGRSLRTTIISTFDGLIYACLTAGTFGWLWPR